MADDSYVHAQIEQAAKERFSSPEAEENIIRRMLKKPDEAQAAIESLSEGDFGDVRFGQLFGAIRQVIEDGAQVDFATVDDAFTKLYPGSANELRQRMVDLVAFKPYTLADSQGIGDHIRIVKALSRRREAIAKIDELARRLRDPTVDVSEALSQVETVAEASDADDCEWVSLDAVNLSAYEYLEKRQSGEIRAIPTGVRSVDEITGGLFQGEMTVVAARPSVGKSAFGLNIAMTAAKEGFRVGFVSCEMDDRGFGQRTLSRGAWVSGDRLRKANITPEDWDKLAYALTDMQGLPVEFMFNEAGRGFAITIERVFRAVKKLARKKAIDLLIVDYIGILRTEKVFKEERLRIAHISAELKRLAMAAKIPVVALCQVNRMAHGRMPTMAELRDSGAVEQDADGILFLHRPENHEDKSIHPMDVASFYAMQEGGSAYIAVSVAKQRNGSTGITQVMFDPGVMRYSEIMRTE